MHRYTFKYAVFFLRCIDVSIVQWNTVHTADWSNFNIVHLLCLKFNTIIGKKYVTITNNISFYQSILVEFLNEQSRLYNTAFFIYQVMIVDQNVHCHLNNLHFHAFQMLSSGINVVLFIMKMFERLCVWICRTSL